MSKKDLTKPRTKKQLTPDEIDAYVSGGAGKDTEKQKPVGTAMQESVKTETARLTVDLPREQHTRFKIACTLAKTNMNDEIRQLITRRCAELEAATK